MADHFGAIASKEIGSTRAPLVFPKPQPKNGVKLPLHQTASAPTAVYKSLIHVKNLTHLLKNSV